MLRSILNGADGVVNRERLCMSDHPARDFQSRTPLLFQEGNPRVVAMRLRQEELDHSWNKICRTSDDRQLWTRCRLSRLGSTATLRRHFLLWRGGHDVWLIQKPTPDERATTRLRWLSQKRLSKSGSRIKLAGRFKARESRKNVVRRQKRYERG